MSDYWLGIDLGTCNSSAAIKTRQGKLELIRCSAETAKSDAPFLSEHERQKEFPSFIYLRREGTIDIGIAAKEKLLTEPERVVWGVKRLLGKTFTELKESGELNRFAFRIRPDRTNGQCLIVVDEKSLTPVHLCAQIFKRIKSDAESQVNSKIDSVVVSVPAYFDPIRVTPIVDAARLAGFLYIKTIPEPVAAALALHLEITVKPIKVLVFDLGAGTLDVTAGFLFRHPDQPDEFLFQVMKNTGDTQLGGVDMDDRLLEFILNKCGISDVSPKDRAFLRRVAETAKIQLSEQTRSEQIFQLDGAEYRCLLDQMDLRLALEGTGVEKNLLEGCRLQIMAAIEEAGWSPQEIELMIPIGGPTKLLCIHEVLRIVFNSNPAVLQQLDEFYQGNEKVDRMTAVSIGAAMSVDRKVDDLVPVGFGIEDYEIGEEEMTYRPKILIPRESPYPYRSQQYVVQWITSNGLFEFKILQQVPKSEMTQFGYEYKFVGIQKLAIRNPSLCWVLIQMGYNANKELEVSMRNIFSTESASYVGSSQFASIGMNYPMTVKKPPNMRGKRITKIPPTDETLVGFVKWVQATIIFVQHKIENHPIKQMLSAQLINEIAILLKRADPKSDYEMIFTKINSLIWNSNSRGLLSQSEYNELTNHLAEFERELFRVKDC
jgi:molecular chaperone DnaK (HSP70)